jgi:hypothetical protein
VRPVMVFLRSPQVLVAFINFLALGVIIAHTT